MEAAAPEYYNAHGYYGGSGRDKKGAMACGEHIVVDDLLALPYGEEEEGEAAGAVDAFLSGDGGGATLAAGGVVKQEGGFEIASADSSTVTVLDSCPNSFSDLADGDFSRALCEPNDMADLEWLSNYMGEGDESFATEDLQKLRLISGIPSDGFSSANAPRVPPAQATSAIPAAQLGIFPPEGPVPAKARSKRSRVAPGNWSSRLLVLPQTPASPPSPASIAISPVESGVSAQAFHVKKPAKKKDVTAPPSSPAPTVVSAAASEGRRCLHCETDKTPQWRTGPMGPKTLCNACGVRYKSGRLVPEYRPAASPTFVMSKHSNSHRKVIELRRQREMQHHQQHQTHAAPGGVESVMHMQNPMLFDGPAGPPFVAGDEFLMHHHLGTDFRQLI